MREKEFLLKSIERYTEVLKKAKEVSKELQRESPSRPGAPRE